MRLILASKSPRRIELLQDAGLDFEIIPSDRKEEPDYSLPKEELTMSLARKKAASVLLRFPHATIIAADTIVYYDSEVLGKPKNEEDAFNMLKKLSNHTHEVVTGVVIMSKDKEDMFYDTARVTMNELSDLQIKEYIATKEPMDKAGSYAIQGLGKKMIKGYEGDFFTIMGLPLTKTLKKLALYK